MIATGIENLDASFWRDLSIAVVSVAGFALVVKRLFWPATISPQPIIVAMEKEFVNKHDFEKFETYIHKANHEIKNEVNGIKVLGQNRDEVLAGMEERTKTHQRSIDNLSIKVDKVVDRIGDKVEQLIRDGTIRRFGK